MLWMIYAYSVIRDQFMKACSCAWFFEDGTWRWASALPSLEVPGRF